MFYDRRYLLVGLELTALLVILIQPLLGVTTSHLDYDQDTTLGFIKYTAAQYTIDEASGSDRGLVSDGAHTDLQTQIYYVAPGGDDSGPGTFDQPWRTIQHASDMMVEGDTAYIRGGVYREQVSTECAGDDVDGYITFSAHPGETPVIDGAGPGTGSTGFLVSHSYVKLIGLEIRNWEGNGIWIEGAHHIEITDCKVHDVCYGIGAADGTHDFVLNRVEMYSFYLYGFDASPSGGADCYNGTLNDCIAHTGRDPEQNVDGFALGHGDQHGFLFNRCQAYGVFDGFDVSARETVLERCSAHDCLNSGYKIWADNVTLINCLSYHNGVTNLELDWDREPGAIFLRNCHFVDCETYNIWVENSADTLIMYNCILASGDNIGLAFEHRRVGNYKGDHNVFHNDNEERAVVVGYEDEFSLEQISAGDWTMYTGQDQNSLVSFEPESELFENLGNRDLHLMEGSIAIDSGTSDYAPSVDYDGVRRPQGRGYDIGAYEYPFEPYEVTVEAFCLDCENAKSVSFNWDGALYTTPETFSELNGSYTASAPDDCGIPNHVFKEWLKDDCFYSNEASVTISSSGKYTIIFQQVLTHTLKMHIEKRFGGIPIKDVNVSAYRDMVLVYSALTDENGNAAFQLEEGTYIIVAKRYLFWNFHLTKKKTVAITEDTTVTFTFLL